MRIVNILIAGLFVFAACDQTTPVDINNDLPESEINNFKVGEKFQLNYGEVFYNREEKIKIQFTDLLEEGRCPAEAMCAWAGNAKVAIQLIVDSKSLDIELDTHRDLNQEEVVDAFSIRLVELAPYPESSQYQNPEEDYTATLVVEPSVQ